MNALSLFSGIGGLDIAAEWAGFKTVAFCERDKFCKSVLAARWPNVRIFDDVRTMRGDELPAVELVFGGYPCQPFSHAGKRGGHADERHLWPEMFRLVRELAPTWVVGENVKGHVTLGLDEVLDELEGAGYATRAFVFPACAVGAPHTRERLFVVAHSSSAASKRNARNVFGAQAQGDSQGIEDGSLPHRPATGGCGERARDARAWEVEPEVARLADGLPRQLDGVRVFGNAVVPQQAYPIFAAIAETYNSVSQGREHSERPAGAEG